MTKKIVRISAELYDGRALWGDGSYEEIEPGQSCITEDYRYYAEVHETARTAESGAFMRESGEHGEIWFPCPERTEFVAQDGVLASFFHYPQSRKGPSWDVSLQPTLGFFLPSPGEVVPIDPGAMRSALTHRIPLGTYTSRESALDVVRTHAKVYEKPRFDWYR